MKIYLVGGAVRDKLLGLPVKERDWVVVGASINDMINNGFLQVGKEFPVFLHPKTREEYALARMERKVKPGYQGFSFDTSPKVSLEDDLSRRDLTINAMAETEDGHIIDPYHGQEDLKRRILRHVSPAFTEDPVRILRIGRFLARFANQGFQVAPETRELMRHMVKSGEVDALVAERVWKELERALGEPHPEKFFQTLDDCHALEKLFPGITMHSPGMKALTEACQLSQDKAVRFSALLHRNSKEEINNIVNKYRLPTAYKQLASLTATQFQHAFDAQQLSPSDLLKLFSTLDIYRRHERFQQFLLACQAIAGATNILFDARWLQQCANIAMKVDIPTLVAKGLTGTKLAAEIKDERLKNIKAWLSR